MSTDDITSELAHIYGVDEADVETTIDYVTSGTLDVTIPDDVSEEEVISALEQSIGDVLGIHPRHVVVTIDDNGDVTYSITGATYDDVQDMQSVTSEDDFASQVTEDLNEGESGIIVDSSVSNDDIEVVISATVDTTDATGTVEPVGEISTLTEDYGLAESTVEGNFFDFFL